MATTPVGSLYDIKEITLTNGSNTLLVTASAPSLKLDESDKEVLNTNVSMGELEFDLKEDGTYAIIGIGNMRGSIEIKPKYRGEDVTEIAANAFINEKELKGVIIPDSVKLIGENAFAGSGIKSVTFKDKEEIIVYFKNTPGWLTPYANYNCESTGEDVYHDVEMVYLEEDLYCINIPLDIIGISFNPGNTSETTRAYDMKYNHDYKHNILYTPIRVSATSNLYNCRVNYFYSVGNNLSLQKKIPGGLVINNNAFQNCTDLTEVSMPRRLISLRDSVFKGCENLVACTYADHSWLNIIGANSFNNCTSLEAAILPLGLETIGNGAYTGCTSLEILNSPVTVTNIGTSAFENCGRMWELNLSAQSSITEPRLKSIGSKAFKCCYGLSNTGNDEHVHHIPSSVTYIGESAFSGIRVTDGFNLCVKFDDINTWFMSPNADPTDAAVMELVPLDNFDSLPSAIGYMLQTAEVVHFHKLKKMLPPVLSLDGDILTIKDNLGVAENFFIYVGEDATDWTVHIKSNDIHPMP